MLTCFRKSNNNSLALVRTSEHSSTCLCTWLYNICWMYWYRLQIKWETKRKKLSSWGKPGRPFCALNETKRIVCSLKCSTLFLRCAAVHVSHRCLVNLFIHSLLPCVLSVELFICRQETAGYGSYGGGKGLYAVWSCKVPQSRYEYSNNRK
jgi:hypothetical protein